MKLDEIREVVELMTANDLTEFELEEDGRRIAIKRGPEQIAAPAAVAPAPAAVAPDSSSVPVDAAGGAAPDDQKYETITAPFVGTFYAAPSPDSPPYVQVGQEVDSDSVLCILEAMKVMNEIKTEIRGVVRSVLVENASPVQYGQPLFKIEKI